MLDQGFDYQFHKCSLILADFRSPWDHRALSQGRASNQAVTEMQIAGQIQKAALSRIEAGHAPLLISNSFLIFMPKEILI